MKRGIASSITPIFALLVVLAGTANAQRSPSDDVRESNDPDRAAEVERKAEAISGRSLEGSGESGEEASETTEPETMPAESLTPGEERSEGESGGTQESNEPQDEAQPVPENSGGSGSETKPNKSSPAGTGSIYH